MAGAFSAVKQVAQLIRFALKCGRIFRTILVASAGGTRYAVTHNKHPFQIPLISPIPPQGGRNQWLTQIFSGKSAAQPGDTIDPYSEQSSDNPKKIICPDIHPVFYVRGRVECTCI